MRYSPYESEIRDVATMAEPELLEYFLLRAFEAEEVWTLLDGDQWQLMETADGLRLPVWPYEYFAIEAAKSRWPGTETCAESLEYFLYESLQELADRDIMLDIMLRPNDAGCLVSPQRLSSILLGMMDAGEYVLEG